MHNRPRESHEEKLERREKLRPKVEKYKLLSQVVFANHHAQRYDAEALAMSGKLLENNPEVYSVWNYRKLAVVHILQTMTANEGKAVLDGELKLTVRALQKNPKSYGTWHHRKWVVSQGHTDFDKELALCGQMLDLDERNFHCWSYRRYIAQRLQRSHQEELEFTTAKIEQNFSNYSAWHYRTHLLSKTHAAAPCLVSEQGAAEEDRVPCSTRPQMYCFNLGEAQMATQALSASVLDSEFDLVQQALFTEPADQSGWLYHRWLLGQVLRAGVDAITRETTLAREVQMLRELLDIESNSKWCMLTLARVLQAQIHTSHAEPDEKVEDVKRLYRQLVESDPMRRQYFQDAAAEVTNTL